jgi:hypothetical protein
MYKQTVDMSNNLQGETIPMACSSFFLNHNEQNTSRMGQQKLLVEQFLFTWRTVQKYQKE